MLIASPGSKDLLLERCKLAAPLWSANIPTECGIEKKPGFMDQIKRADKEGIPIVVVMGEEELQKVRADVCVTLHAQIFYKYLLIASLQCLYTLLEVTRFLGECAPLPRHHV